MLRGRRRIAVAHGRSPTGVSGEALGERARRLRAVGERDHVADQTGSTYAKRRDACADACGHIAGAALLVASAFDQYAIPHDGHNRLQETIARADTNLHATGGNNAARLIEAEGQA